MTTLSLLPVPGEVGVESNTSGTRILVLDGKLSQTEEENRVRINIMYSISSSVMFILHSRNS